jgi:hypothetical protein
MKATLEAINQIEADPVIGRYGIGGAVGATFYLEPAATLDLDIFATLPAASGGLLLSPAPIHEYLKSRGGKIEDEYGGWPVQFLAPRNDPETKAVAEAVATTVEGVPTWVMSPEHVVAIALGSRGKTTTGFCSWSSKTQSVAKSCRACLNAPDWPRRGSSLNASIWKENE